MALEVTALIAEIVRRLMDCASVDEAEDAAVIEATHPGGVLQRVVDDATVAGVRSWSGWSPGTRSCDRWPGADRDSRRR